MKKTWDLANGLETLRQRHIAFGGTDIEFDKMLVAFGEIAKNRIINKVKDENTMAADYIIFGKEYKWIWNGHRGSLVPYIEPNNEILDNPNIMITQDSLSSIPPEVGHTLK